MQQTAARPIVALRGMRRIEDQKSVQHLWWSGERGSAMQDRSAYTCGSWYYLAADRQNGSTSQSRLMGLVEDRLPARRPRRVPSRRGEITAAKRTAPLMHRAAGAAQARLCAHARTPRGDVSCSTAKKGGASHNHAAACRPAEILRKRRAQCQQSAEQLRRACPAEPINRGVGGGPRMHAESDGWVDFCWSAPRRPGSAAAAQVFAKFGRIELTRRAAPRRARPQPARSAPRGPPPRRPRRQPAPRLAGARWRQWGGRALTSRRPRRRRGCARSTCPRRRPT
jgi:hypothetical protein